MIDSGIEGSSQAPWRPLPRAEKLQARPESYFRAGQAKDNHCRSVDRLIRPKGITPSKQRSRSCGPLAAQPAYAA